MASSDSKIVSDTTTISETAVAEDFENTDTVTIDNVFHACCYGDLEKLRKFVEEDGASLSMPDNDGYYSLQWAALNNRTQIIQYIIEHGGDVNAVDKTQQTALHWTAVRGHISAADVLLHNGALLEASDLDGFRPVHVAAQYGQTSFLNHIVAKHNADFDVPDNAGRSPLHWTAYKGFVDTIRWLLSRDASQERQDIEGCTPLHWAAIKGKTEVCKVLIEVGTKQELWMKDMFGNTPVQLASAESHSTGPFLLSKALQEECKNMQNLNLEGKAMEKGDNWPMIIAMQGDAYTGKSSLAKSLALRFKCTIICLDDVLAGSEHTDDQDTLISHAFNIIAEIVKTHISLGLSVVIDSPLSRLSHLQKLVALLSTKNILHHTRNTRLLIMECKPNNLYAYQLRFEATNSVIYRKKWYKPAAAWPLPKLTRDYTDADIPPGVSKLVVDTSDYYSMCQMYKAMVDVTSCGCGHISKYGDYWHFIHEDKTELFNCPHCSTSSDDKVMKIHKWTFYQLDNDLSDIVCGVCDNQVSGSCYVCTGCLLTLHKPCAELGRGDKKYFVPESFPRFMPSEPHLTHTFPVERPCSECRKQGSGFSSKCKDCLFESHLKSRLVPTVVRHKAHDNVLTLWLISNNDGPTLNYMCLACRKYGQFAAYVLDLHCMYHPECLLLPPSIEHNHGGYTHDLEMVIHREEEMEDYLCAFCLYKMNPIAWYYHCSTCNIQLHLRCAFLDFDS